MVYKARERCSGTCSGGRACAGVAPCQHTPVSLYGFCRFLGGFIPQGTLLDPLWHLQGRVCLCSALTLRAVQPEIN